MDAQHLAKLTEDPRFGGIRPFSSKVWLSSPTMHGEELAFVEEAFRTNWVSTVGENIDEIERQIAEKIGRRYAVATGTGTGALHLAVRLCAEKLYGAPALGHGALEGRTVFVTDVTFAATVNAVAYEGGRIVLIDSERDTWNMDPLALEKAFTLYPDTRLVVMAHLYGVPGKMEEIEAVCARHGALLVEDAAESFSASYKGKQTGSFGDISICSFNGNKLVTGSSGGMVLTDSLQDADRLRKWSTQSREAAPWYQHEELGFNYRMSNIIAGVVRGQLCHVVEHRQKKQAIYERYRDGLRDLPVKMYPFEAGVSNPNYWLSCIEIDREAMCPQKRDACTVTYEHKPGKSCPTEILEALDAFNAEGRPIWKPMHLQPFHGAADFVSAQDTAVGEDIFERGLCLPSDIKMTEEEQQTVIRIVHACFR
ncbi:MAG: DegT/DnrJ/EryC1/StrS family aminotransferase [Acutalibacteraceae bacterium]|jgi:dTDP-4-amino-4,6-dideoxygalactose transaminase